ncbi:MAG: hypothetical protein IKF47_03210 [Bacilli bacterium]|nr:hypothetical protein [Bacilli bacterium]
MDIVEFLTSKEIIVVYIVAAVACLLCFIIYLVEKHNDRGRKRHNTKELNKLVEQIKEEVEITPEEEITEPVLQTVIEEPTPVVETLEEDSLTREDINAIVQEISTEVLQEITTEAMQEEKKEEIKKEEQEPIELLTEEDELEYTSIEPDVSVAKEELHKITEELKEQEEKIVDVVENARLTDFEVEQEENAIISLEELVKKSKEMYEANELTQYKDEGNEPISISELEVIAGREAEPVTTPFVIANVVPVEEEEKVVLEDFNTIKTKVEPEIKKFKSSPIISPIYGIEKQESEVGDTLELENTANYEKLDAEIKKTNEFLMTLKELQSKLD